MRVGDRSASRFSDSDDEQTHGRKIYALYAKDRNAYVGLNNALPKDSIAAPIGPRSDVAPACDQVIEKESYHPEELRSGETVKLNGIQPVQRNGKTYHAGAKAGLFVMAHVKDLAAAKIPADLLDDGWLYASLSADGETVNAVGRIESCMHCHADAPHGRLFGLVEPK